MPAASGRRSSYWAGKRRSPNHAFQTGQRFGGNRGARWGGAGEARFVFLGELWGASFRAGIRARRLCFVG